MLGFFLGWMAGYFTLQTITFRRDGIDTAKARNLEHLLVALAIAMLTNFIRF